ncbi:MAG TPA: hypothetical protein VE396_13450 [Xanthobacteraceae bacterium]|nr:hypothetical protein [Xanthobacteraceae bacterium]
MADAEPRDESNPGAPAEYYFARSCVQCGRAGDRKRPAADPKGDRDEEAAKWMEAAEWAASEV